MSNNIQIHTGEEKYFGDDEYFSEEESSSSFLDEDDYSEKENEKTVSHTIPPEQMKKEMPSELSAEERKIREEEFKMINEDLQEEADSSSNAYISDEVFDSKLIKTNNNHSFEEDSKNPRSISSMKEHLAKRNEEIEERIKERRMNRESERRASHRGRDEPLGRRRRECTREDGSLSSADSHDDYRSNEHLDKHKLRLEHREKRRSAKEKRRQARLERREERLQQKIDRENEKIENETHKHSKHHE